MFKIKIRKISLNISVMLMSESVILWGRRYRSHLGVKAVYKCSQSIRKDGVFSMTLAHHPNVSFPIPEGQKLCDNYPPSSPSLKSICWDRCFQNTVLGILVCIASILCVWLEWQPWLPWPWFPCRVMVSLGTFVAGCTFDHANQSWRACGYRGKVN